MDEYIERKAAIIAIKNLYPGIPLAKIRLQKWHDENKNFMECELAIERIPAADVAPVRHGKWENNHCSVCGMMPMGEEIWDACEFCPPRFEFFMNYCPNCGAKMDGDGDV